jgi:hypothetical protein
VKTLSIFGALSFFLWALPALGADLAQWRAHVRSGDEAFSKGELKKARAEYLQALQVGYDDACEKSVDPRLARLARIEKMQVDPGAEFSSLEMEQAEGPAAEVLRAHLRLQAGRASEARTLLEKVLKECDKLEQQSRAYLENFLAFVRRVEGKGSDDIFEASEMGRIARVVEDNLDLAMREANQGWLFQGAADASRASKAFRSAISRLEAELGEQNPVLAPVLEGYSSSLSAAGDTKAAKAAAARAKKLRSKGAHER